MNDKAPALSTRPIVLQTAQVMINTNTQQWELRRTGQCGSRESLRRDVQTASLPPRLEVSGDRCQSLSGGELEQSPGRISSESESYFSYSLVLGASVDFDSNFFFSFTVVIVF